MAKKSKKCGCPSRTIPKVIKMEVRQRCGFGCVICGLPIIEYHHIEPWAKVKEHRAENITLLCNNHHRRVGAKLIPDSEVKAANASPASYTMGDLSPEKVWYTGHRCRMLFGETEFNFYAGYHAPILIDNVPVFGVHIENGRLSIDFQPFPAMRNGLAIVDNEVILSPCYWQDIEWVANRLTIKAVDDRPMFQLRFEPPETLIVERGIFIFNSIGIVVDAHGIAVINNGWRIGGLNFDGCEHGLAIGSPLPESAAIRMEMPRDDARRTIKNPPTG